MMLIYSGDEISARTKKGHPGMQQDEHRGDRKDVVGENTLSKPLRASLARFKP